MTQEPIISEGKRLPGPLVAFIFFGAVAVLVAAIAWLFPSGSGEESVAATTTIAETSTTAETVEVSSPAVAAGAEPVADAAEVILPSVVDIATNLGSGSGVIYDSDGLIVTAAHVVAGVDDVRVRFADGEQVGGTVVGSAPEVDIAVIEVDRGGLPAATFSTAKPRVGQLAVAVGSPWGLESTVTAGIISAVDQTDCSTQFADGTPTCTPLVQTDAAINPGNSGGALVDRYGQVVGINVSIFSSSGANDGVGFAVPSGIVSLYADSIVSGEPVQTAFLGVQGEDVDTEGRAGAVITVVVEGSGAESAGIETGDVVIGFDDVPVLDFSDLVAQVRVHRPGETVDVLFIRDDVEMTVSVTLGVDEEPVG
ncbi:MAG: trypsin-like peptidase domain-containing protein [Acidimicrobiia bacterium]